MRDTKANNWLFSIQHWFYPTRCLLCDGPSDGALDLCSHCNQQLPRIQQPCAICGMPLTRANGATCGKCLTQPPAFDALTSPLAYEDSVRYLIHGLKYRRQMANARLIGSLLSASLRDRHTLPQAILPVPLHRSRLQQRGFNQALEIARHLSRDLGIPIASFDCQRTRATPMQSGLTASERRRNIRGAFACGSNLNLRHIAIVDDVVTTGATVEELARTLKKSGVEQIEVWAGARA